MPRARGLLCALCLLLPLPGLSAVAVAQEREPSQRWWAGVGVGGGSVESLAPAPSAGRSAVDGSLEVGYRLTSSWGLGMELGALAPVSGCREAGCSDVQGEFAPAFNRLFAFGEFRPRNSGLRLRAGMGLSRFCYTRHWDEDAWSMLDTLMLLFDEDYLYTSGSGSWRCDAARRALGGAVSVGYDWRAGRNAPVSLGVRVTAEAARFSASPAAGLPAFHHRAVMLSLHLLVH
ncbi:MAG: hypothetical protein M3Y79_05940 [Pseudomonadota bacterium]|nr:hypothetical protein [Pseudomonadota bacterium]